MSWRNSFRSYQLENAEWLSEYESGMRARLLADGLGTGKTRSALAGAILSRERGHCESNLILGFTTASSVHDWRREAEKCWPGLKFIRTGEKKNVTKRKSESTEEFERRKVEADEGAEWRKAIRDADKLTQPTLVMGDYWWAEQILEEAVGLQQKGIYADQVICDEAHLLKKSFTQRASSLRSVVSMSRRTTLLTATPVHNRPYDLYNLLSMCAPLNFSRHIFGWATPYYHFVTKKGNYRALGALKDKPALTHDIKPYVWGRTAAELMGENLPARTFQLKMVDVPGALRISPAKMRARKSEEVEALLRDTVRHKLSAAVELVRDAEKPVVLYTYRREDAEKLAALLNKEKIPALLATGDQAPTARDKTIERWKAGEGIALVCTMDAVRESATLTRADMMVFVDLHWLPAVLLQCQGRIDPARQPEHERRPVTYYYLITRGGPDEVVAETLVEKLEESSGIGVKSTSGDRLADFLRPLDSRPSLQKALDPKEMMASLVERLNARADRLADLGML